MAIEYERGDLEALAYNEQAASRKTREARADFLQERQTWRETEEQHDAAVAVAKGYYEAAMRSYGERMKEKAAVELAAYEAWRNQAVPEHERQALDALVERLMGEAELWHGTGRYRYASQGESKHEGVQHDRPPVDVLASMLRIGIRPAYDPWAEGWTKKTHTVSLTQDPMLARIVAEPRLEQGERLGFAFGSSDYWWNAAVFQEGLDHLSINSKSAEITRRWLGDVSHDVPRTDDYIDVWAKTKSTIPGNYPVVFGMKREGLTLIPSKEIGVSERFEQRSVDGVPVTAFSHIEVPWKNLEETKQLVASLGVEVPVIPIEEAERWRANHIPPLSV